MGTSGKERICTMGHRYYKSSDCPVCPVCEREKSRLSSLPPELPAAARRTLEAQGIYYITQLAQYRVSEILRLHGLGKSSIPILRKSLKKFDLTFKNE